MRFESASMAWMRSDTLLTTGVTDEAESSGYTGLSTMRSGCRTMKLPRGSLASPASETEPKRVKARIRGGSIRILESLDGVFCSTNCRS